MISQSAMPSGEPPAVMLPISVGGGGVNEISFVSVQGQVSATLFTMEKVVLEA